MRVSIVTISFNQARFIEQAIRSVIEQDYDDLEYIVVDAGSTDGSREIIRQYEDKIAKIIFEQDDGPADGLNKGFRLATGEVFGFVNADDMLLPGAVSSSVRAFEENPVTDVVWGNGYVIGPTGDIVRKVYVDKFDLRRFVYGCVTFIQTSAFFRRKGFEEVGGFNVANTTCWDGELMIEFGIRGKSFLVLGKFLSCFRLHENALSSAAKGSERRQLYNREVERLFFRALQRKRARYDILLQGLMRIEKWLRNPRNVIARMGI